MPFTPGQLDQIGYTSIENWARNTPPVDQVNYIHPWFAKLNASKQETVGGAEMFREQIYIDNDDNSQNYFGADPVGFNERDTTRQTSWAWYNKHTGFGLDEDTIRANGLIITDDRSSVASNAELVQLNNLLKTNYYSMEKGLQESLDIEFLLDGTLSTKSVPGLDHIVSTLPTVGTVGGLAASNEYWQNNVTLGISTATPADGTINAALKDMTRSNSLYGGKMPDFAMAGRAFIEALEAENRKINTGYVTVGQRGGTSYDGGVKSTYFNGLEVIWNPTFDKIDETYGSVDVPWTKRCYLLNMDTIKLRPVSGYWMLTRSPKRMPDRYVHYWAQTCSYRLTCSQRNANAVLSIA